jgi:CheY-like chemotaxis protein
MAQPIPVLVVEDEELIRLDIVDFLEQEGFVVYEAADADKAIVLLEKHPSIRVLFSDIDMPGSMDGLKLAAQVRDRWPPVKIVITSGHKMVEIIDLPDGSIFFSKPYKHLEVASAFREITAA